MEIVGIIITVIFGITGGIFALVVKRKRITFDFVESVDSSIKTLQKNKTTAKFAVHDSYPIHYEFYRKLRPYLVKSKAIDICMKEYKESYEQIQDMPTMVMLSVGF